MSKAKTTAADLIDTTVQLRADMLDLQGDPHANAGQQVRIIEARARNKFTAETPAGAVIVIDKDDFTPDAPKAAAEGGTGNPIAYRHPSGDTWSGRGKQPAWVKAALENGRHLSDFAVEKNDTTSPAAPVSAEFAEQLQVISLYTDPTQNVAQLIDLDLIDDSPTQPRTHYPEDYLDGLAASMRAVGMISPMLVRPKAGGRFENVFGHCRKRGAIRGGLTQGPCFVRELTDAEAAQLQAVENLQRKDLDAFDEAQSFAAYIKAHGCTKDEFCRRTGLSRTQVYNRLKLSTLHDDGVKALRTGKIKQEVATLLARVPGEKHQAHALKLILEGTGYVHGAGKFNVEADPSDELMTVRKARGLLREKFTLGLKGVIWALDDATLVESAGACTVCPKRSGCDPVLYTDLLGDATTYGNPKGENVCTDPACFDSKKTAQLKANQAALEAKGKTVIAGNKARQAISAQGEIKGGYIAMSEVRAAIKKGGKGVPLTFNMTPTVLQDPRNGKTVDVVKIDDVKAAGIKVEAPKPTGHASYGSDAWKAQEAQREAEREKQRIKAARDTESNIAVFQAVRAAAMLVPRNVFDLQEVARMAVGSVDHWQQGVIRFVYDVDNMSELGKKMLDFDADQLAQLIVDCALARNVVTHGGNEKPEAMLLAAKHYGVDVEAVRKQHADDKKAQAAAQEAADKAAAAKLAAATTARAKKNARVNQAEEVAA